MLCQMQKKKSYFWLIYQHPTFIQLIGDLLLNLWYFIKIISDDYGKAAPCWPVEPP